MSKNLDLAIAAAKEMAARHERGEYNRAKHRQTEDNIDGWVGRRAADGKLRWPAAVTAAAGKKHT
jgi:hypothetical protein